MAWLARSVWPLVGGWNPDDKLTVVPMSVQKAFQNLAENWGPLYETMLEGMPCNLITCVINNCAFSDADGSLGSGMKWTALESWYRKYDRVSTSFFFHRSLNL